MEKGYTYSIKEQFRLAKEAICCFRKLNRVAVPEGTLLPFHR